MVFSPGKPKGKCLVGSEWATPPLAIEPTSSDNVRCSKWDETSKSEEDVPSISQPNNVKHSECDETYKKSESVLCPSWDRGVHCSWWGAGR